MKKYHGSTVLILVFIFLTCVYTTCAVAMLYELYICMYIIICPVYYTAIALAVVVIVAAP